MERKLLFITFLAILLTNLLGMAIEVETVKASGTIYIRADGSIDPPTANITSVDNVTYIFTGNNYDEIVVERNNIVVDGAGYTLQGAGSGEGIALFGRSNVTLRNIEINAFHYGVFLDSSSNYNTVSDNNITANGGFGVGGGVILHSSSNYNTVSGNNITNNDDGVFLYSSSNNTVSGNNITNNRCGLYLDSSSYNTVSGNTITAKYLDGVYLYYSSNNTVSGNNITNNRRGIYLDSSSYNIVSGNNITNNWDGVLLDYSSNNTVSGNNITANNYNGVLLYYSSNNTISGNNITNNNDDGIYLSYSNYNTVSGNNITDNWYGVRLRSSSNYNTVSGNSFVDDGLFISNSFGNVVVDNLVNGKPLVYLEDVSDLVVEDAGQVILVNCNRIRVENLNLSNTDVGAQLWNTHNTTITGNNITSNSWFGVFLYSSSNNTVSGNNVTANGYAGVGLYEASNNTIYHNNFVNNIHQTYFIDSMNVWDDGCEGNFWSDYNGIDSDGDGIGDTPYIIDGSNQDNHPLMNPYWNPTDINHDLTVDIFDVVLAVNAYRSTPSDLHWNCHCDIAEPYGVIDIFDIVMICSSYGEEY